MPQTETGWKTSFSLSAKNWEKQRAERLPLCPVFGLVSALRLLSSRAVPSVRVIPVYQINLSSPRKGDISTLQNWGTFLLCIDTVIFRLC